jgi:uncharacterized protein (UPF0335 family)
MANQDTLDKPDALAAKQARAEQHGVEGFHALLADHKHSSSYYEEMDGDWRQWPELSAEGKLSYLAGDAAYYDVPFHHFAEAVRDVLSDQPPAAREDAALRLLLSYARELQGLARLLPDNGRTEPTPLIDRFREWWGMESGDRNLLLAQDAVESAKTQLESFSDEFERLARTQEQKQLADHFKEFVQDVSGAGMREAFEKILGPKTMDAPAIDYEKVMFGEAKIEPQQTIKSKSIKL